MVRKIFSPKQTINKLREVEVLISQGATTKEEDVYEDIITLSAHKNSF